MFLGTPRKWWFVAVVPLVPGFVLLASAGGPMHRPRTITLGLVR